MITSGVFSHCIYYDISVLVLNNSIKNVHILARQGFNEKTHAKNPAYNTIFKYHTANNWKLMVTIYYFRSPNDRDGAEGVVPPSVYYILELVL